MTIFAEWHVWVNRQNHDGVTLTPLLKDFLVQPGPIKDKLGEIDQLRKNTRMGRFDPSNEVERDLEYHRFNWAYHEEIEPEFDPYTNAPYDEFVSLPLLGPQTYEELVLDGQNLVEARRVAYEAYTLLGFLLRFRAETTRPIVIIGNDRYGRQWGVEALEEYLKDDFTIVYPRVPSHRSTRLTVPNMILRSGVRAGPDRGTIRYLSSAMPHVIVVDARNVGQGKDRLVMRMSRGARDYANWFIAFNDLRAGGDVSKYEDKMPHASNHFPELKRWYGLRGGAEEDTPMGRTGGDVFDDDVGAGRLPTRRCLETDFRVKTRPVEYGSDAPQVVMANPIIYRTDGDDPTSMRTCGGTGHTTTTGRSVTLSTSFNSGSAIMAWSRGSSATLRMSWWRPSRNS